MTDREKADTARPARSSARRAEILDCAERMARRGGYNGFSFREIAAEIGIKSASVHYHFPTKAELSRALAARYADRFIESLGPPAEPGAVLRLIAGYRAALREADQMCLCGIFGAEIDSLPEPLADTVRDFFERSVAWASACLGETEGRTGGETLISGLEGALIAARALGDAEVFDRVATRLLDAAKGGAWSAPDPKA
ncbi:MAG: TetR/AcrR family transcriptional regulator [Pikeienuella sp.]